MIIQNPDGSLLEELPFRPSERYYAEVAADDIERQTTLIERIIAMAFDVLGARHVELRVHSKNEEH